MSMASSTVLIQDALSVHAVSSVWNSASDLIIMLVLVVLLFLFAYYVGRGPFVAVLLSLYCSYAVYALFPYMSYLPTAPAVTALLSRLGLYTALVVIFYIILRRVVVSDFLYIGIFGLIALSFLGAALLIAMAYHIFPIADVYHFSATIDQFFKPDAYFFWWFVAPAVGLFFLAR